MLGLTTPSLATPNEAILGYREESQRVCERSNGACQNIARQVADAATRWIKSTSEGDYKIPDYISAALAVKIIGFESIMNPDAKAGSYEGLAQFNRHSGKFVEVKHRVVDYINGDHEIRDRLLALIEKEKDKTVATEKKIKPHQRKTLVKKTSITEIDLMQEKVFRDVDVQVSALMFGMADASTHTEKIPALQGMPLPYTQAFLYLLHQLPSMGLNIVVPNIDQETSVSKLVKTLLKNAKHFPEYYQKNSGIYTKDGSATPMEILHRVAALLQEPFRIFYQGADKDDAKYTLPSPPLTCRSRRSMVGWAFCRL